MFGKPQEESDSEGLAVMREQLSEMRGQLEKTTNVFKTVNTVGASAWWHCSRTMHGVSAERGARGHGLCGYSG